MRIVNRVLLSGLVIVFLSALFYKVSGFTFGSVKSLATVMITDNSNALISIPSFDENKRRYSVSDDGNYYITIINNMDRKINARCGLDYDINQMNIVFPTGKSIRLNPGESGHIPLTVCKADDEQVLQPTVIKEELHVTVFADWDGGNAEIEGVIDVALRLEPPPIHTIQEQILGENKQNEPDAVYEFHNFDTAGEKLDHDQSIDEDHTNLDNAHDSYKAEDSPDINDSHDAEDLSEARDTKADSYSNDQSERSEEILPEI